VAVRIVRVVAALLSLVVVAVAGYGWFAYRTLNASVSHLAGVPTHASAAGAQNILLVGDDHRPADASPQVLAQLSTEQDGGATNTDTLMVLHMPADGGQATVISLPRDSWVDIPGIGKTKLNAAFAYGAAGGRGDAGGMSLLVRTVENMTGLTIDHFVRISLLGFYDVAQALGPVQVCLNQPVNDPYSGLVLPAGVSTLDAKQALSFVRQRHGLPRGDLDREVRQQYFLSAELHKLESSGVLLNPVKLKELLTAVGSAVQTDPQLDLLQLAEGFSQLAAGHVRFTTIPILGTPTITDSNGDDVSIVAVDWTALRPFIAQIVGEPRAYDNATAARPETVTLDVVNGTGQPGLARAQVRALQGLGFDAVVDTTGEATTLTTVTYPPGQEAQAKAVAAAVPGAAVAPSSSVQQVTLRLGADGKRVAVPAGASSSAPSSAASSSAPASPPPSAAAPVPGKSVSGTSCVN
jgi:LCP family protein required for cell wall assembly